MPTTFPTSKEALALYFSIVVVYLTNNATRLKISSAYILALAALYGDDETDDCYLSVSYTHLTLPTNREV